MAKTDERSGPQVLVQPDYDGTLNKQGSPTLWYNKVRLMRRDPTIALARDLVVAPILAAGWTVSAKEDAPEGAMELIESMMDPLRYHITDHAMRGWMDFGWQPFETVFGVNDRMNNVLVKTKPLIQDFTEILVEGNGAYDGLEQCDLDGNVFRLEVDQTLTLSTNVEGTDWYGEAILRASEDAYDRWKTTSESADKYEKRVAGSHWVCYYPDGQTSYNGQMMDNYDIALAIVGAIEANSKIILPRQVDEIMARLNKGGDDGNSWKLELITDSGSGGAGYVERLKYLDALKVRGCRLPERSILEGQFGTKADATAHADFAIVGMEQRHQSMVLQINWHLINRILRFNYGPGTDNLVFIEPAPINDTTRQVLIDVYKRIIGSPEGMAIELADIDRGALRERLGIPIGESEIEDDSTDAIPTPEDSDDTSP